MAAGGGAGAVTVWAQAGQLRQARHAGRQRGLHADLFTKQAQRAQSRQASQACHHVCHAPGGRRVAPLDPKSAKAQSELFQCARASQQSPKRLRELVCQLGRQRDREVEVLQA